MIYFSQNQMPLIRFCQKLLAKSVQSIYRSHWCDLSFKIHEAKAGHSKPILCYSIINILFDISIKHFLRLIN